MDYARISDTRELYDAVANFLPDQEQREKVLHRNGTTCFAPFVSQRTRLYMEALRLLQRKRNTAIISCMCEVRDFCIEDKIPYAFLKGLCLATRIYDPIESRIFDDVDILVK